MQRKNQPKGCGTFCCGCRLSISSSEEAEGSNSDRYAPPMSSLAHAMVQERLDQMIREREEARNERRRNKGRRINEGTKCIIMVAMDKYSYDPREDFKESMVEMIIANRLEEPKELRCLLNCFVSMNAEEYRQIILEVFHEVLECTDLVLVQ
ncbi:probable transcription repressor OFP9 [Telopea speciosissima]|uniref:probable transcription repressor OFP9 n=1 Tax=Telopea speciosissima TaxID=54955 RepID=UPI001CC825A5|nr:probable transcription repressor OFP9 [Telopea speciosissima]